MIENTDGEALYEESEIIEVITNYFTGLFTSNNSKPSHVVDKALSVRVSEAMNDKLPLIPSAKEIKESLFNINLEKSLGMMGFRSFFLNKLGHSRTCNHQRDSCVFQVWWTAGEHQPDTLVPYPKDNKTQDSGGLKTYSPLQCLLQDHFKNHHKNTETGTGPDHSWKSISLRAWKGDHWQHHNNSWNPPLFEEIGRYKTLFHGG